MAESPPKKANTGTYGQAIRIDGLGCYFICSGTGANTTNFDKVVATFGKEKFKTEKAVAADD